MKRCPLAALGILALLAVPVVAQDKPKPAGAASADQAAMEEAMMKAATPGPNHKLLDRLVGDWITTYSLWMAPGQAPVISEGTMHAEWILGGRYVQSVYKGSMGGMPYEGRAIDGYDNVSNQYVGSMVDNMSTGMMTSTGSCDAAAKVCTHMEEMSDPATGKPSSVKSVVTFMDGGFKMEMFAKDPASGAEMKMFELVAKKK